MEISHLTVESNVESKDLDANAVGYLAGRLDGLAESVISYILILLV